MNKYGKGYVPRNYSTHPLGSIPFAKKFDMEIIPRSEWPDRIDYLKEKKASIIDVKNAAGINSDNQNGYGLCWAYGFVMAFILSRAVSGLKFANLNPFALAMQVTGFVDRGGNAIEALQWLVPHGCPDYDHWPKYSMDRNLAHAKEVKENAIKYRSIEWMELEPRNLDQTATCLLNGISVAAGYEALYHMMAAAELVYRKRGSSYEFGIKNVNSWGVDSGDNHDGTMTLWGRDAEAFDQIAPFTSTSNV